MAEGFLSHLFFQAARNELFTFATALVICRLKLKFQVLQNYGLIGQRTTYRNIATVKGLTMWGIQTWFASTGCSCCISYLRWINISGIFNRWGVRVIRKTGCRCGRLRRCSLNLIIRWLLIRTRRLRVKGCPDRNIAPVKWLTMRRIQHYFSTVLYGRRLFSGFIISELNWLCVSRFGLKLSRRQYWKLLRLSWFFPYIVT